MSPRSSEDPGWREFVFAYDAPPDPDGLAIPTEQLAQMVMAGDPTVRRVFCDFDYAYARRRLIEAMEFDAMNRSSERLTDKIMESNRNLDRKKLNLPLVIRKPLWSRFVVTLASGVVLDRPGDA